MNETQTNLTGYNFYDYAYLYRLQEIVTFPKNSLSIKILTDESAFLAPSKADKIISLFEEITKNLSLKDGALTVTYRPDFQSIIKLAIEECPSLFFYFDSRFLLLGDEQFDLDRLLNYVYDQAGDEVGKECEDILSECEKNLAEAAEYDLCSESDDTESENESFNKGS